MLQKVLKYFEELSKIPRCSGNEQNAREWIISWAKNKWFNYKTDKIWNIVVIVPASVWMEERDTIIMQWHLDMVCNKTSTSNHNFENDPIKIFEKDWFLIAENTTLWADDGIWIAIAMAMADLDKHPKLEILITVNEEIWLTWALNLDSNILSWKKLINLDTEVLWEIIVASAWWIRNEIIGEFDEENWIYEKYTIKISWLKWWHSWTEIDKSKWNSSDALMEFLEYIKWNVEFYYINSWIADNVIPSELECVVWIENNENILGKIGDFIKDYRKKYDENNFEMSIDKNNSDQKSIWKINSKKLLKAILSSKSWVYKFSDVIEWFVLTSQSLWILKLDNLKLNAKYLIRSSIDEELFELEEKNRNIFSDFAKVISWEPYPGWVENNNSILLNKIKIIYEKVVSGEVKVLWIHAWLECWTIKSKMPVWTEVISIWPNIYWAHTPEERCEIKSIEVICKILEEYLKV